MTGRGQWLKRGPRAIDRTSVPWLPAGARRALSQIVVLSTLALPACVKPRVLNRLPGWSVGRGVRIGFSLLFAESVVLADEVSIGHFNIVVNVDQLVIGRGSTIRNFNAFHGGGHLVNVGFPCQVTIGERLRMMSHHFADCAGTLLIGNDVTIGGRSTEIYTHQRSLRDGLPVLEPSEVSIGDGAYIGARCTLVSCAIPPGAVVGAGAVVVGDHLAEGPDERVLLAGNPARVMKRYPSQGHEA